MEGGGEEGSKKFRNMTTPTTFTVMPQRKFMMSHLVFWVLLVLEPFIEAGF